MRVFTCLLSLVSVSLVYGQDPTVPGDALLHRLNAAVAASSPPESHPIPVIRLRSMVMRDHNQGSAIIESGNHRYRLTFDRGLLQPTDREVPTRNWKNQVQIDGRQYWLEDFRPGVVILNDGHRKILVQ